MRWLARLLGRKPDRVISPFLRVDWKQGQVLRCPNGHRTVKAKRDIPVGSLLKASDLEPAESYQPVPVGGAKAECGRCGRALVFWPGLLERVP